PSTLGGFNSSCPMYVGFFARLPNPGAGNSNPPTNRMILTTTSAGLLILAKRAFLKKSELNSTRKVERISHCDSAKALASVLTASGSHGGVVIHAGTCGSSATKKLYKWRAINR